MASTGGSELAISSLDVTRDPAAEASREVAVTALRLAMGLMTVAAVSDWVLAIIAGAGWPTMVEGVALTGLSGFGLACPERLAHLLRSNVRVLVPVVVFAGVGVADIGLPSRFTEVAVSLMAVTAILSSPRWVGLCVVVSIAGYLLDLAASGRSPAWIVDSGSDSVVATQVFDLAANAGLALLLIALWRRFTASVPARLAAVHRGGPSLTPALALATRPAPLTLPRADSAALTRSLTASERSVLDQLVRGRTPKQIALDQALTLATVRSHIANAKRKVGARTLEQLAAVYAEASHGR